MDFMSLLNMDFILLVLLATGVAMVVNWIDPPTTVIKTWQSFLVSFISTLIASFMVAWAGLESGMDIYSFIGFALVVGGALGGIVTIRGLVNAPEAVRNMKGQ